MARGPAPLRLFVAAYPPRASAESLLDAVRRLEVVRDTEHRLTPPEQVHLTLQFIGSVAERAVDGVLESVRRSAAGLGAFELAPRRLTALPERGPARLIAAVTDAPPALIELHARLARRLARGPRPRPSDRYLPHLTLCRFGGPRLPRGPRADEPLSVEPFPIRSISLMRSILRPSGSEHREVARVELDG